MPDEQPAPRRTTVLDGHHELTVRSLTRADASFTVDYSITPPLPDDLATGPATEPLFLWLEAEDDLGNAYTDYGGARGLSPDGRSTEGRISGQPALPAGATALTVRFVFLTGGTEQPHPLTLPVPPGA
ncbi:hypothetical protein ACIA8O_22485 [Kitasatospora sp. NPDC051853]|uniref:hypothetical protein n=1 Tax=Kitasatospora sp. NPDC051853 TaxID=3364058 RepID=UPI0037B7180B